MRVKSVLLVCSGNTCRSPMASVVLQHLWEQAAPGWALQVRSAGTGALPGLPASEHAVTAMRRRGLDLSGHRSGALQDAPGSADVVLTMTTRHKEHVLALRPDWSGRVYTLGEYAGTGDEVPDPFGGTLTDYEATARTLEQMLRAVVDRIRREGTSN